MRRRAAWKGLGPIGMAAAMLSLGALGHAASPQERFRQAGALVRGGDYPKAIAIYGELAASGSESASLYWNWAQAALARGAQGEALWALLRARELDPADRAVGREIERLREAANLDRAEIAPEPLAALARTARRFRLDAIALVLLLVSLAAHAGLKWRRSVARLAPLAWTALTVGLLVAVAPVAGSLAHPTGTVIRRGAPLLDAASPTAEAVGTLREGEVVPILESSGGYVRVEDSSGARGWALSVDVRPVEAAPRHAS
ncbi:MAG TPA: SH3 domain-containing protein [Candidatus Eisenbacteria bacterium]